LFSYVLFFRLFYIFPNYHPPFCLFIFPSISKCSQILHQNLKAAPILSLNYEHTRYKVLTMADVFILKRWAVFYLIDCFLFYL
jgi:hypothetical protein